MRGLCGSHRVLAPDHLGFGLSERPDAASYTPEAHSARFAELADSLDLRDVTLVVHEYGGPIALPWAIANPERVRHIVYLNTFVAPFSDPATRIASRVFDSWLGRFAYGSLNFSLHRLMPRAFADRSKLTPAIHQHYLAPFERPADRVRVLHPLAIALVLSDAFFARLELGVREVLARIPATIIWGVGDRALGPRHLASLRRLLLAAKVHALETAGHWPHEELPSEVAQIIARAVGHLDVAS